MFPGPALGPEDCYDSNDIQALVAWRDRRAPHLEVWLSEFGWDSDQHSPNRVPIYGAYTAEDVQGIWIVRAFVVLAAQGLSRVHQYMLRDVVEGGYVQFSTSGLVTSADDTPYPWAPKPAWFVPLCSLTRTTLIHTAYLSRFLLCLHLTRRMWVENREITNCCVINCCNKVHDEDAGVKSGPYEVQSVAARIY